MRMPTAKYCPCVVTDDGNEVSAFGRGPTAIGSTTYVVAYDDGISVVVHWNSSPNSGVCQILASVCQR